MGQGGKVRLVNNTSERWTRVHQHSYQMNSWDFPDVVEAGHDVSCYVEWDQGWATHEGDDAGEARYRGDRSGYEFEVQARNFNRFLILVQNISVPRSQWGYPGGEVQLLWEHNGTMSFELPGSG